MTWAAALREATRRWGLRGIALVESASRRGVASVCKVGVLGGNGVLASCEAYGRGLTWEEAFADADRRAPRGDVEVTRIGYVPLGGVTTG